MPAVLFAFWSLVDVIAKPGGDIEASGPERTLSKASQAVAQFSLPVVRSPRSILCIQELRPSLRPPRDKLPAKRHRRLPCPPFHPARKAGRVGITQSVGNGGDGLAQIHPPLGFLPAHCLKDLGKALTFTVELALQGPAAGSRGKGQTVN